MRYVFRFELELYAEAGEIASGLSLECLRGDGGQVDVKLAGAGLRYGRRERRESGRRHSC